MIAIIEVVLQVTLVLIVFIAGYRIGEVMAEEYAHDKNMHEQRACTKISRVYKMTGESQSFVVASGSIAGRARNAPMPIAVHRRRAQKKSAPGIFSTRQRSLRPDSIYAYPRFHLTPFTPALQYSKISFNTILCVGKNIYLYLPL